MAISYSSYDSRIKILTSVGPILEPELLTHVLGLFPIKALSKATFSID